MWVRGPNFIEADKGGGVSTPPLRMPITTRMMDIFRHRNPYKLSFDVTGILVDGVDQTCSKPALKFSLLSRWHLWHLWTSLFVQLFWWVKRGNQNHGIQCQVIFFCKNCFSESDQSDFSFDFLWDLCKLLMVNCWFGAWWFFSFLGSPYRKPLGPKPPGPKPLVDLSCKDWFPQLER